jgi:multiple sugar transport system substrate-binding protein
MNSLSKPLFLAAAIVVAFGAHAQETKPTITLNVSSFPDLDRGIKSAIPLYKKLHPEVEIKLTSLAYPDHHTAMTTILATGSNVPDVMAIDNGFIGKFAESGGLEDLSKPPYNALAQRDKLAKFAVNQSTNSSGALAALPVDIGPGALFYRKDLLDKAGVTEADMTKSWESYIESGKKVKAATGAYMLANALDIKDIYIRSGLKDGDGIYFDKKGNSLVNTPRFEKAFQLAKAARTAGIDGKIVAWSNEWSESFKRDKIATQMMGGWLAGHLNNWLAPESKGKWRSAQLPNGAYGFWGGSFYAIPKQGKNKQAAWDFIQFLTFNKEMQLASLKGQDSFPVLLEAQKDPFIDEPMEYLGGQKARQAWRTAAEKIPATVIDKFDPVAESVVNAELDKVLEQNKDIKKALADAQSQIKRRVRR